VGEEWRPAAGGAKALCDDAEGWEGLMIGNACQKSKLDWPSKNPHSISASAFLEIGLEGSLLPATLRRVAGKSEEI
jgi:hypothetical protein